MLRDEGDLYSRLGRVTKELRVAQGLTQDQVATRLNLRRTSVTNIESGTQGVSLHAFVELAKTLGASPIEMLATVLDPELLRVDDLISHSVNDPEMQAWVRSITQGSGSRPPRNNAVSAGG